MCVRPFYRGQHINLTDTLKFTTLAIVSKKNLDENGLICVISNAKNVFSGSTICMPVTNEARTFEFKTEFIETNDS